MSAQNDSAFLRMFLFILGGLVAFAIIILLIAGSVSDDLEAKRAGDSRLKAEIAKRIAAVGQVEVVAADAAPAAPKSGDQVVAEACNACHGSGALGAPKVGDAAAWNARMSIGVDGLVQSAIAGKGAMPPRGGAAALSDAEILAAVEHMLKESGVEVEASMASAPAPGPAAEPAPAPAPVAAVVEAANSAVDSAMGAASGMAEAMMPVPAAPPAPAAPEAPPAPAAPAADLAKGKLVYDMACFVCHTTGAAGAPRLGDAAAWAPRTALGMDALNTTALNGKGGMPPKGGRMDLSDADVKAAVAYMVENSK